MPARGVCTRAPAAISFGTQNEKRGDSMSSRWQSRVFVFLGATLGLSLVAGLVVAAGLMHG